MEIPMIDTEDEFKVKLTGEEDREKPKKMSDVASWLLETHSNSGCGGGEGILLKTAQQDGDGETKDILPNNPQMQAELKKWLNESINNPIEFRRDNWQGFKSVILKLLSEGRDLRALKLMEQAKCSNAKKLLAVLKAKL